MFLAHTKIEDSPALAAAVIGACRLKGGWVSEFQPFFLELIFKELLGVELDFNKLKGIDASVAVKIFTESKQRLELIELLVLVEMMVNPVPPELESSIENWANILGVEDRSLLLARDVALQCRAQAQSDFYRLFWMGEEDLQSSKFPDLLKKHGPQAWTFTVEPDESLSSKWNSLSLSPKGSIGEAVWNHYQSNGFIIPGELGGANAALAHHDWLHVLGDYKVDLVGEVENAAFGAASSSMPGSTLWFLGVMAMYEGGLFDSVVTGGQRNCISAPGIPERIVNALKRGRQCNIDLLSIDYFSVAERQLKDLKREWQISSKD